MQSNWKIPTYISSLTTKQLFLQFLFEMTKIVDQVYASRRRYRATPPSYIYWKNHRGSDHWRCDDACLWPNVPNKEEILIGSQFRICNNLRLQIRLQWLNMRNGNEWVPAMCWWRFGIGKLWLGLSYFVKVPFEKVYYLLLTTFQ